MKIEIKDKVVNTYADWHELVTKYQDIFENNKSFLNGKRWKRQIQDSDDGDWYGCNDKTMINRIKNGYKFPEINLRNMPTVPYERPRPRFTDDPEGEFDNDMFDNGETEYFLSKPKKVSVGGIRMKVQIGFRGTVKDSVMTEYFTWVGQTIQAIQARGYDLELYAYNTVKNVYPQYKHCFHNIKVSKFGERVMPAEWSALFSPGSHRHFMFMLNYWAGEEYNLAMNDMGASMGPAWKLIWEKDTRTLFVQCDSRGRNFPAEQMTKELDEWKD